jgi:hypothetical protein
MQSYVSRKRLPLYILVFVLVLESLFIGFLLVKSSDVVSLEKELTQQKESAETQRLRLLNEIDYQKSLQRPVILAREKLVVFPELNIALPYNDVTKTLQYSFDDGENMRVTSTRLNDSKDRQMGCSDLVRINMQDGSPFSPWEAAADSVKLSDGRTVHIIVAKAFKNNEASTEECASEVWTRITPGQLADEFKKAHAY